MICLRWVSENYTVQEDIVVLAQLENTTADTMYQSLKACLLQIGITFDHCSGQDYDGAATFQGDKIF